MKYAWDWFHYHADQRLKSFNYFVLAVGILVVAYGAAMKQTAKSDTWFMFGVALCGVVISITFLLIEVRNAELVDYGRNWLDCLEGGLDMTLRRDDLPPSLPNGKRSLNLARYIIRHKFLFRAIYVLAALGFVVASFCALWRFH